MFAPAKSGSPPMLAAPMLSDDDLKSFQRDGYVIRRKGFGPSEVRDFDRWSEELLNAPEVSGRHWVYWEKSRLDPQKKIVSRIENIAAHHAGFRELTQVLKGPVGQLLGEPAALFKEKINFKFPGADGFKPHQDSQAGWQKYASYFISVLVCIDRATEANGCLKVVPGFHRKGLFREWEPLSQAEMDCMTFLSCETEPGDLVFFDSYAPHGSEPNMSNTGRRLYYVTYNRLSEGDHLAQYYADKHKSYPPDIDRLAGKDYVFRV